MESTEKPAKAQSNESVVKKKLDELRLSMKDYRKTTGFAPRFLLEKSAPQLPSKSLENCKVFSNRNDMMLSLAKGGRGAEVGVQHGHFSKFLLDNIKPKELHLFDLSDRLIDPKVKTTKNVTLYIGDSSKQLAALPDRYFDWIYIDGDHSYSGALKDATVSAEKIKRDGILFFNDYILWAPMEMIPYGVIAVVNEFVAERGFDMIAIALSSHGFFDVALKRPS